MVGSDRVTRNGPVDDSERHCGTVADASAAGGGGGGSSTGDRESGTALYCVVVYAVPLFIVCVFNLRLVATLADARRNWLTLNSSQKRELRATRLPVVIAARVRHILLPVVIATRSPVQFSSDIRCWRATAVDERHERAESCR